MLKEIIINFSFLTIDNFLSFRCFARYVPIIAGTLNETFREEFGKAKSDVDLRWFWKKVNRSIFYSYKNRTEFINVLIYYNNSVR